MFYYLHLLPPGSRKSDFGSVCKKQMSLKYAVVASKFGTESYLNSEDDSHVPNQDQIESCDSIVERLVRKNALTSVFKHSHSDQRYGLL